MCSSVSCVDETFNRDDDGSAGGKKSFWSKFASSVVVVGGGGVAKGLFSWQCFLFSLLFSGKRFQVVKEKGDGWLRSKNDDFRIAPTREYRTGKKVAPSEGRGIATRRRPSGALRTARRGSCGAALRR